MEQIKELHSDAIKVQKLIELIMTTFPSELKEVNESNINLAIMAGLKTAHNKGIVEGRKLSSLEFQKQGRLNRDINTKADHLYRMNHMVYRLYQDDICVGFELWEPQFGWSYTYGNVLSDTGWRGSGFNGHYLKHNSKKLVSAKYESIVL